MKYRDPVPFFALCSQTCQRADPMTPEEVAAYRADVARKEAEDDRRRQGPDPQLQLPEVA